MAPKTEAREVAMGRGGRGGREIRGVYTEQEEEREREHVKCPLWGAGGPDSECVRWGLRDAGTV